MEVQLYQALLALLHVIVMLACNLVGRRLLHVIGVGDRGRYIFRHLGAVKEHVYSVDAQIQDGMEHLVIAGVRADMCTNLPLSRNSTQRDYKRNFLGGLVIETPVQIDEKKSCIIAPAMIYCESTLVGRAVLNAPYRYCVTIFHCRIYIIPKVMSVPLCM